MEILERKYSMAEQLCSIHVGPFFFQSMVVHVFGVQIHFAKKTKKNTYRVTKTYMAEQLCSIHGGLYLAKFGTKNEPKTTKKN